MLSLGFSAGLPILLIFSSLSLWLREAAISRSEVTYFSWAALGYSFKFVWSPLVDQMKIPFIGDRLGKRRSWLLLSQIFVIFAIISMAMIDPKSSGLSFMALAAVLLGFSSATQDIVIDAYRIELAESDFQATLASTYIAGYRIGMIAAGAGSLYLADYFGSSMEVYSYSAWRKTYFIMAGLMFIGILTTLLRPEPKYTRASSQSDTKKDLSFFISFIVIILVFIGSYRLLQIPKLEFKEVLSVTIGSNNKSLISFILNSFSLFGSFAFCLLATKIIRASNLIDIQNFEKAYASPIKNFFDRYGKNLSMILLFLIGFYRVSDIVLGVISNVFYQDMGFSKSEIASAVKTFGVVMSLLGGFIGGLFTNRYGVWKMLWWGGVFAAGTNLLFLAFSVLGKEITFLYAVIALDNLAAGLASAAFVAFLSSLTDIKFTAVQYAIFTSLMTLFPKILGGYSGGMVDQIGYPGFFIFTTLLGLPVLVVIQIAKRNFKIKSSDDPK